MFVTMTTTVTQYTRGHVVWFSRITSSPTFCYTRLITISITGFIAIDHVDVRLACSCIKYVKQHTPLQSVSSIYCRYSLILWCDCDLIGLSQSLHFKLSSSSSSSEQIYCRNLTIKCNRTIEMMCSLWKYCSAARLFHCCSLHAFVVEYRKHWFQKYKIYCSILYFLFHQPKALSPQTVYYDKN